MSQPVKSADRVLQIFELLAEHPDGITLLDVQSQLGIPRSSAHGLLQTLLIREYLVHDKESGRFRSGIRLWQVGRSYLGAVSLERTASPILRRVRDDLGETVQLAVLDGTDNIYVAKMDSQQNLRLASYVGARLPAYATGIGKALLSMLADDDIVARYGGYAFVRFTDTTVAGLPELLTEVGRIRERGWAEDHAEHTPGVYCVAFPVTRGADGQLSAVSVSLPTVRSNSAFTATIVEVLRTAAEDLARRIP